MVEEPDGLVLTYLRRIDAKLDRVIDEVRDVKVRPTAVGEAVAGIHRRIDRLEMRVGRIERRLDLVETPHWGAGLSAPLGRCRR